MTPDARTPQQKMLQRKQALWTERSSWDSHCQEIADYLLPRGARISQTNRGGASNFSSIIDNSATSSHGTLEAGLMAGMTSPARPWMKLATPDRDLMEYAPVKRWLSKVSVKMLAIFAASNTYRSFRSMYGQLGAFGVGASVIVNDFENVLHHYPLVFGQYALGLDHKGKVNTLYRTLTLTVSQVVEQFGTENISQSVRDMWEKSNYDNPVEIIHAIEPRRERDYAKRDNLNMAFKSCYLEVGRDGKDGRDKYLSESGFTEFPALCPRWMTEGDDIYASRWPAATALGDIKQLQQEQLRKSQAIDFQTDPPLQVPLIYKDQDIDRLPGGSIYVDMTNPQGGVRSAFEVKLDLQHLLIDIQDVRQRIGKAFFEDLFKMLANDDRSGITAREIAERHEEKLLMLGPVLESLHGEMLKPAIDITFSKMLAAGLFRRGMELEPPKELHEQSLDVEFISTLAQAQRAVGTTSVDRLIGTIGSLSMIKPEVLDKLDGDQAVDVYADMLGVDPSIILADDQVVLVREKKAKQQQMAQMAAMAQPAKDAALAGKAVGETDADNLASAMSRFQGYGIPGLSP